MFLFYQCCLCQRIRTKIREIPAIECQPIRAYSLNAQSSLRKPYTEAVIVLGTAHTIVGIRTGTAKGTLAEDINQWALM